MFDFSRGFARLGVVLLAIFEAVMLYAIIAGLVAHEIGMAVASAVVAVVVPAVVLGAWRAMRWVLRGFVRS